MSDTAQTPEQVAGEEPKPARKLPMIAAIVVGLAIGGGTGAAVIGPVVVHKLHLVPDVATVAGDSTAGGEDTTGTSEDQGGKSGEGKGEKGAAAPSVQLIENLVLNPAGSGGSRFLLLTVAIECTSAKGVEALTSRDAEVRDVILTTLGTKTVEQLSDVTSREQFKTEIANALGERIGTKQIKRLYFPQFVVQ